MAAGYLPAIGTEYGPCEECDHTDCAQGRADLAKVCKHCDEPIGTRAFYNVTPQGELSWSVLVHAVCEHEAIERRRKTSFFGITMPANGTPCAQHDECGHAGRPNICEGDGRRHRHGMVHTVEHKLEWLCGSHMAQDRKTWQDTRQLTS